MNSRNPPVNSSYFCSQLLSRAAKPPASIWQRRPLFPLFDQLNTYALMIPDDETLECAKAAQLILREETG